MRSIYSYSYDNIGNRKTAQEAAEEATAYDANNLNQYTAIQTGEEAAFVPTFDADGNQTKVKTSTGIWNVVYNAENRPVTFTSEDGATIVECTYDYMGRRHTRKITVNGTINAVSGVFQWFILWDPTQPVATRPLGIRKDGTWYTYGWDLTKNICEVFGSDGYIKTAYTYTPYGAVTANGNVTQPIQWSSEYSDSELGLVYYNYRHYNPADGRWTGRDFISESLCLYDYVYSSPLVFTDTLGLKSFAIDEDQCTITLKLRYDVDGGAENQTHANEAIRQILAVWNQTSIRMYPQAMKPHKRKRKCCPCRTQGFLPLVNFRKSESSASYDVKFIFFAETYKGKSTSFGYPIRGFSNSVIKARPGEYGHIHIKLSHLYDSQPRNVAPKHTAPHEFGHALGLMHPGQEIIKGPIRVNYGEKGPYMTGSKEKPVTSGARYAYIGWDIWNRWVNGETDLMGLGLAMRAFYFEHWYKKLNSKYKGCRYNAKCQ